MRELRGELGIANSKCERESLKYLVKLKEKKTCFNALDSGVLQWRPTSANAGQISSERVDGPIWDLVQHYTRPRISFTVSGGACKL